MKKIILNLFYFVYSKFKNRENDFKKRYYQEKLESKINNKSSLQNYVNGRFQISDFSGLILGENIHLGDGLYIESKGGVIIGDHTHISQNVSIYSTNHNYEGDRLPYDEKLMVKPVYIGKYVWIGRNVNILPGVCIGDGAIIAMGSTITKDVLPGEVVGSSKQFVIGNRNISDIKNLEEKLNYGGVSGKELDSQEINLLQKKENNIPDLIFVFSTGRSGSATIVDYLNQNDEVSAYHEAFYTILKVLSLKYLTGKISKESAKFELSRLIDNFYINTTSVIVHSDQKLVPFIGILNELYPKAKFIWLIRNPKSFLKSVVSRGWYDNDDAISYKDSFLLNLNHRSHGLRVNGVLVNELSKEEWSTMDIFQKNLWYWKYWNGLIENQFENLPGDKKLKIKLEDFDQSLKLLHDFMGLKSEPKNSVKSNSVKKRDKKKFNELNNKIDDQFQINLGMVEKVMVKWGY